MTDLFGDGHDTADYKKYADDMEQIFANEHGFYIGELDTDPNRPLFGVEEEEGEES